MMASLQSYLLFVCLFSFFIQTDGFFLTIQHLCYFRGEDPLDVEYVFRIYSNRVNALEYNSTLNRFSGYTPYGESSASHINQDPLSLTKQKAVLDLYCKHYGPLVYDAVLLKMVQPYVRLSVEKHPSDRHPTMLKCSAYKFYPRKIRVTWLRDGQEVPMSSTEELANGDWYYQIHSYLEFTPTPGEKISCMVEHPSLTEPMILHWEANRNAGRNNTIRNQQASPVIPAKLLDLNAHICHNTHSKAQPARPLNLTMLHTSSNDLMQAIMLNSN
ncbi:H-2 class II histocompatibility antigen, E-S beta chain isoform X5 [Esox lucius]|uniref:H-2 class II histocompatibility antigen, E-S beta chain isoform X5 n=1 Tax=Esox lucius TaxID=8010 RepID=UPI00147689C1|nr:H-2 class II histocompatibility antigen, E-S beta chain isoform X5 [Esox lucius]